MWTDFQNSFSTWFDRKFSTYIPQRFSPHLQYVAALPCQNIVFRSLVTCRRTDEQTDGRTNRHIENIGNFVLVGLPAYLQRQLQSVLNAAARLVFRLRCYDHITDALAVLHWLRVPQRVDFKIAVMRSPWRSECCMVWLRHIWISWFVLLTCLVVALAAYVHQRHSSWTSLHTGWNPSAVGRFRSPHQLCGTLCHLRFSRHLR